MLAYLREDEQEKLARREAEERKGYLVGGVICMALGVAFWLTAFRFRLEASLTSLLEGG